MQHLARGWWWWWYRTRNFTQNLHGFQCLLIWDFFDKLLLLKLFRFKLCTVKYGFFFFSKNFRKRSFLTNCIINHGMFVLFSSSLPRFKCCPLSGLLWRGQFFSRTLFIRSANKGRANNALSQNNNPARRVARCPTVFTPRPVKQKTSYNGVKWTTLSEALSGPRRTIV